MKKISEKWNLIAREKTSGHVPTIRAMLHDVRKLEAIIEESNDLCALLVERGLLIEVSRGKFVVAE